MTITIMHPRHGTLVRFAYGDSPDGERQRVAKHLLNCEPCRASVSFTREVGTAAAQQPVPAPAPDLLGRVLAARAAGQRVILPATEPSAAHSRRGLVVSALAVAAVLLLALGLPIRNALRGPDTHKARGNLDTAFVARALSDGGWYFATAASAQEPPRVNDPPVPGITGIDGTRLREGELRYQERWTGFGETTASGIQSVRVVRTTYHGRAAWRLEHKAQTLRSSGRDIRTETETLWVDQHTLQLLDRRVQVTPLAEYRALDITQGFNGDSLIGHVTASPDTGAPFERSFLRRLPLAAGPLVTDALSPLLLSSVTLGPKWEGSLAVLGWALMERDFVHPVTLRVTGAERITVPAGTFDCWRVAVRMDGQGYTAWVRKSDGVGVRTWDESARNSRGIREVILVSR